MSSTMTTMSSTSASQTASQLDNLSKLVHTMLASNTATSSTPNDAVLAKIEALSEKLGSTWCFNFPEDSKYTGSRGVAFVRKNYPSYILPCKIHNLVILINKFALCNLCEFNLNGFLIVPYTLYFSISIFAPA